jgi:hypothetical protein
MPTPKTNFRLSEGDKEALDLIAASWEVDRTTAIRRLIFAEVEAGELAAKAREALLRSLRELHGDDAALSVTIDGGSVVEATVNGEGLTGARALVVFGTGGSAATGEILLEAEEGPGSIVLATVGAVRGEITFSTSLDRLGEVA